MLHDSLDSLRERFRAAWEAAIIVGEPPSVEDFLADVAEPLRARGRDELGPIDSAYRGRWVRLGNAATIEETHRATSPGVAHALAPTIAAVPDSIPGPAMPPETIRGVAHPPEPTIAAGDGFSAGSDPIAGFELTEASAPGRGRAAADGSAAPRHDLETIAGMPAGPKAPAGIPGPGRAGGKAAPR